MITWKNITKLLFPRLIYDSAILKMCSELFKIVLRSTEEILRFSGKRQAHSVDRRGLLLHSWSPTASRATEQWFHPPVLGKLYSYLIQPSTSGPTWEAVSSFCSRGHRAAGEQLLQLDSNPALCKAELPSSDGVWRSCLRKAIIYFMKQWGLTLQSTESFFTWRCRKDKR
jgi:hypothetical protein